MCAVVQEASHFNFPICRLVPSKISTCRLISPFLGATSLAIQREGGRALASGPPLSVPDSFVLSLPTNRPWPSIPPVDVHMNRDLGANRGILTRGIPASTAGSIRVDSNPVAENHEMAHGLSLHITRSTEALHLAKPYTNQLDNLAFNSQETAIYRFGVSSCI